MALARVQAPVPALVQGSEVVAVMMARQLSAAARRFDRDLAEPGRTATAAPERGAALGHPLLRLQRAYGNRYVQRLLDGSGSEARARVHRANITGMPDDLKSGIEGLSGLSLDDVRVHHNSPEPARLLALAYTRGTNIYLGPGQAGQLPHEAWHVVQQKQGRVRGGRRGYSGAVVADDPVLEIEADSYAAPAQGFAGWSALAAERGGAAPSAGAPIQCRMGLEFETGLEIQKTRNYSYGEVLVSGKSGWEAIFDNYSLEIRTSPEDTYGSLDTTMKDVSQFIMLVKNLLGASPSVTLLEVAESQSGERAFDCVGAGAQTVISRRLASEAVQLTVKKRIEEIKEEITGTEGKIRNLVPRKPGSGTRSKEEFEQQINALPDVDRKKLTDLRHTGKRLQVQQAWESHKLTDADLLAQPQMTVGVPLSEINLLLIKAARTPLLAYGQQFTETGVAQDPPYLIDRPVTNSGVIRGKISNVTLESDDARERYVGFLSLVCLYVRRGMRDAQMTSGQPEYAKSYFDVMSRTDFNLIYQMLSGDARTHFKRNGEDTVTGIVWPDEPQQERGKIANRRILSKGTQSGTTGPTLGQWIESIYSPSFSKSDRKKEQQVTRWRYPKGKDPEPVSWKTIDSPFVKELKEKYIAYDEKLMGIPDIAKAVAGRSLGSRDLLSRGEVLWDSQSMGLLGYDPHDKDTAFPYKDRVLLEFRGIQGELYSRYWTQLAEQLFRDFRFTLRYGNYEFKTELSLANEDEAAQFFLQKFLKFYFEELARGQTVVGPGEFWPLALTNKLYYNWLRSLLKDVPR